MSKEGKTTKLPEFKSEKEAAAFWDTHGPEDFLGEFEPVKAGFTRPLIKRRLTVKLSDETIAELRQLGEEQESARPR